MEKPSFDWHPQSFEHVVRDIDPTKTTWPEVVYEHVERVCEMMGSLSCPAPNWDPKGNYRVAVHEKKLRIDKQNATTMAWEEAPLTAPK